jgi:CRP/FNR family transcriptional regulator
MILQQSPLFGALDKTLLQRMLQQFQPERWHPGCTWPIGHELKRFFVVTEGLLELTRTHPQTGRTATLFLLQPGDGFDVVALFDGIRNEITPVALTAVELLSAPIPMVRNWVETHVDFHRACSLYLSRELRALQEFATDLVFHDTATRLGKLILQYVVSTTQDVDDARLTALTVNDLSPEAMARMIGSSRVVVNRTLNQLKERGYISTRRGQLHVHDLKGLRAFCRALESE